MNQTIPEVLRDLCGKELRDATERELYLALQRLTQEQAAAQAAHTLSWRILTLKTEEPERHSSAPRTLAAEAEPLRGVVPVCAGGTRIPNPQHQKWDLEHYSLKCDSTKRLWT